MSRDDADARAAPTFRSILRAGLPPFLLETVLPLGAFLVLDRAVGLGAAIVAATGLSLLAWAIERHAGRPAISVRLSFAFIAVQALVGVVSGSAEAYLGTAVVGGVAWSALLIGSTLVGRPLAGELARAWYPFTLEERRDPAFLHVFGVVSVVWGVYALARAALRLTALVLGGTEAFVVLSIATDLPITVLLGIWSIRYPLRVLGARAPEAAAVQRLAPGAERR